MNLSKASDALRGLKPHDLRATGKKTFRGNDESVRRSRDRQVRRDLQRIAEYFKLGYVSRRNFVLHRNFMTLLKI